MASVGLPLRHPPSTSRSQLMPFRASSSTARRGERSEGSRFTLRSALASDSGGNANRRRLRSILAAFIGMNVGLVTCSKI